MFVTIVKYYSLILIYGKPDESVLQCLLKFVIGEFMLYGRFREIFITLKYAELDMCKTFIIYLRWLLLSS